MIAWLAVHLGRFRWLMRPVCKRRGRHKGEWKDGISTCRTCGESRRCAAPPGTLLIDEKDRAVMRVDPNGKTLRRIDKFHGSKKERRRNREAVRAAAAVRQRYTGGTS